MFTSAALIILICIGLIAIYRKLSFIQAARALPGPKMIPVLGNAHYFLQRSFDDFLQILSMLMDTYPSPFRFWLGNKLIILLTDPDQIKTILQNPNCLNKATIYDLMKPFVGLGILTAPASTWVAHRKVANQGFNINILRASCDILVEQSSTFMDKLEQIEDSEVDFLHHIIMYNFDTIHATLLGVKLEKQSNKYDQYIVALQRMKEIVLCRIRNVLLIPDIIFNLTPLKREFMKNINLVLSYNKEILLNKVNVKNNLDATVAECTEPSDKLFLDILMEEFENKKLTQEEILYEINTIIAGAIDTSAITLSFAIFMLANFPKIQENVYKELLEIYNTQNLKSAPIKFEDLQHMKYLERVLKETMRLFPALPLIGRQATEDLKIGEFNIPKGVDVIIGILALHRNEKYWPNALKFDPDRFLPENKTGRHPDCYIPFSNGRRNCIGMKYAMISMKVFLATLVRTYVLKVDRSVEIDEIKLKMDIFLAPMDALKVKIIKRNLY